MFNSMKSLNLLVADFTALDFGKDAFLVPYYLSKQNGIIPTIIYPLNKDNEILPKRFRGVNFKPLSFRSNNQCFSFKGEWYFIFYILKHAKEIDVLMRFHFSYQTFLIGVIYKLINKKSVFYIKGDGLGLFSSLMRDESKKITKYKNKVIRWIVYKMCNIADVISTETPTTYNKINSLGIKIETPIILMLNGFDEELLRKLNIQERSFKEKENIILAVGRIGHPHKNIELLLKAIESTELRDWKLVIVGPIEEKECHFQDVIDDFYIRNKHLVSRVIFTGAIYDKRELWEFYNRAKVFVHMAPVESYGIVFGEAFRFNNFIVSTDVGIAAYLIKESAGRIYPNNDFLSLSCILQDITSAKIDIETELNNRKVTSNFHSWEKETQRLNAKCNELYLENKI